MKSNSQITYSVHSHLDDDLSRQLMIATNEILGMQDNLGFAGPMDPETGAQYLASLRSDMTKTLTLLLARTNPDGAVVGQLMFRRRETPNSRHIADLSRVFVLPRYRNPGVLTSAAAALVSLANQHGIELLCADARAGSVEDRLWRMLGFSTYGVLPDYSRANGKVYSGNMLFQPVQKLAQHIQPAISARLASE